MGYCGHRRRGQPLLHHLRLYNIVGREHQRAAGWRRNELAKNLVWNGFDGRVLAFGGTGGVDPLDSMEEWDPKSDGWLARENQRMPTAMHGFGAITVKIEEFCA